jgi:RNA polymerase sigma factor (sigma-70 family)
VPRLLRADLRALSWDADHERRLCQAASEGDREATRELLVHFGDPLFSGVILPRVGSRADAEDLLRETMLRAVESIGRFEWREGAGLWPWLRRIAINLVADHGRRLQARRRLEEGYAAEVRTLPPRVEAGAEAALIAEEERRLCREQLVRALSSLGERYRRALELRLVEGRSREEAAEALGVTVGTFDVVLHRATKALRRAWPEVA